MQDKKIIRPTRFYSKKQEDKVAKVVSGKRVSNSGATSFNKGDVVTNDWLIECKTHTTMKTQFTIKKEWLDKNVEESFAMNKSYSALAFDFGDSKNYYIIDERIFKKLLNLLKEENYDN